MFHNIKSWSLFFLLRCIREWIIVNHTVDKYEKNNLVDWPVSHWKKKNTLGTRKIKINNTKTNKSTSSRKRMNFRVINFKPVPIRERRKDKNGRTYRSRKTFRNWSMQTIKLWYTCLLSTSVKWSQSFEIALSWS